MPRKSSPKRPAKKAGPPADSSQRLQRLLASAGFGSRRQCEELIEAGRVEVDGAVVTKLGTTVDPAANKVRVDGVLLRKQKLVYYAVNKPVGVVTTNRDPQGRARVVDLVPRSERVFPVGRLDRSSEGLILLTNDGDLAQKLSHPKFGVRKIYRVTVAGKVKNETMKQMRKGIYIAEGFVRVDGAKLLKTRGKSTEMEIVLREGKNREIRRILASLGHKVQQLRRIAVGPLRLGDVPPGAYRVLSGEEVKKLWRATEVSAESAPKKHAGRKRAAGTEAGRKKRFESKQAGKSSRPASKKSVGRKTARRDKPPVGSIAIEGSQRTGSVIGADTPTPSETPKRRAKSSSSKRKGVTAKKRGSKKISRGKSTTTKRSNSSRTKKQDSTAKGVGRKRTARKRKSKN